MTLVGGGTEGEVCILLSLELQRFQTLVCLWEESVGGVVCLWEESVASHWLWYYWRSLWAELNGGKNNLHWKANMLPLLVL